MGFGQAVATGFTKYVTFSGRACRSEFWYWVLFTVLGGIASTLVDASMDMQIVSVIFNLLTAIPSLAVSVRRLHDVDASGWWVLLSLIPVIGAIALLVWVVARGTEGPNRFGPDPLAATPGLPNEQYGAPA